MLPFNELIFLSLLGLAAAVFKKISSSNVKQENEGSMGK